MERKGTFKELIYTRCGPAYSIRGEQLPNNNGYAIFDSSEGLWSQLSETDLQFAERVIARQFQWSYGCPVKQSWSYLLLPHGEEGVFTDLYAYTEEDGANNSESSNMRGSHLAQMLCGIPSMYPYELIRSSYFFSRQRDSTDCYYLRECAPRLPEMQQQNIASGPITPTVIQNFMQGRISLVQNCVAWLIEQMGKLPKDRRPIVILDQSENIPYWIAAITCHFPICMARCLPFYTCREGLERVNTAAFYRANTVSGDYAVQVNMQDPNQESRPLAMLLGCAAEDTEASRQVAHMSPDASCVLLNGLEQSCNFIPESTILKSTFVRQISTGRNMLLSQLPLLDELENIPFSTDFLPLYDALISLTSKAQPALSDLVSGIRILKPYDGTDSVSILRILNANIEQGDYLSVYAKEDARNGYSLLGELISLTEKRPAYQGKMCTIVQSCLKAALQGKVPNLQALWKQVQNSRLMSEQSLNELIGVEHFSFISSENAQSLPEENCAIILQMHEAYISVHSTASWANLVAQPDTVTSTIFQRSVRSPALRRQIISLLRADNEAMDSYLVGGAMASGNSPVDRASWWKATQDDGSTIEQQHHAIQRSKHLSTQDLEQAMIVALHREGISPGIVRLYEQCMTDSNECGVAFFKEATQLALTQNAAASPLLEQLWSVAQKDVKAQQISQRLLSDVDQQIRLDANEQNEMLVRFVSAHAGNVLYPHASAYHVISQMLSKSPIPNLLRRPQNAMFNAWQKANPKFYVLRMDLDLAASGLGQALLEKASDHSDEMASHLLIIAGFSFTDVRLYTNWINAYVDLLSEDISAKDPTLGAICALQTLLARPKAIPQNDLGLPIAAISGQVGNDFLEKNTNYLLSCYQKKLSNEKKISSYAEKWEQDCANKYGETAAELLKKVTDQAISAYQINHKDQGGFLGRLFGRK